MIVNKVAASGIITIDLSVYLPVAASLASFDLKPMLFKEMILREKDFRQALTDYDWQIFAGKQVAVFCSVDAIIPVWAYMLVASYIKQADGNPFFGDTEALKNQLFTDKLKAIDPLEFADKRVVIKGCGETPIPDSGFLTITSVLLPVVKSIMYGEPCSTVPVYKKPKPSY